MVDHVDIANPDIERWVAREERKIRAAAASMPTGEPGECDLCGEEFARLVHGVCARCRDARGLP